MIDPFSDILQLTKAQSVISGGFTAGGSWAIRFPKMDQISFSAQVKGGCWLCLENNWIRVETGDVLLISTQQTFVLAGDRNAEPVDAANVLGSTSVKPQIGTGDECAQIGGFIRLDPARGALLADVLPPLIHVRASSSQAISLQWILEQMVREQSADLPGATFASAQLAQLMFVHILRTHLSSSAGAGPLNPGWLRAFADPPLATVLRMMHSEPSRPWRLAELAKAAAMSRTVFAQHFRKFVGVTPLAYLTNWRMRLAQRTLREDNAPIASLAHDLGYTSESAFSNAFKRFSGTSPKRYRSGR